MVNLRAKRILLVCAEVALVLVILALLAANWVPIIFGPRPYQVAPP
jgi:hypothetical protein